MLKRYAKKQPTATLEEVAKMPTERTLYFRACDYNRALIVARFMELLNEARPTLRIETEFLEPTHLVLRLEKDIKDEGKKSAFVGLSSPASVTFNLGDDYEYHLTLCENPFFEGSSYFHIDHIETDSNGKRFKRMRYPQDFNINDLFCGKFWGLDCDIEENAKKLLGYFFQSVERKPSQIIYERKRVYEYGSRRYHYEMEEYGRTYIEE